MRIARLTGDRIAVRGEGGWWDVTDQLQLEGHGDPVRAVIERGTDLERLDVVGAPFVRDADAVLLAPVARPSKIVGAPVNYRDHQIEMQEQKSIADYGVFLKAPSSIIGPGQDICLPYSDQRTDQEGELGVVIGRRARHVSRTDALEHVFGYVPILDITVRSGEDRSTRKSFDTFSPVGPYITTRDEVPDPAGLTLRCWVDGELRQSVGTDELIFDVPTLISYASHVMTLEPGDIIATGTPAGVGSLTDGGSVVLEISGLGRLEVGVTGRDSIAYADRPGPAGERRGDVDATAPGPAPGRAHWAMHMAGLWYFGDLT
ncbi:fumarylacetoacetate hydrolase family protein [Cellulomonas sp. URHD0024]|uniref:fumarylacetoacetate hydrolase family protein n=1 Tax=Cellulomonas sp. URHD0024 TaxID=1302620 RepID=UPI0003F558D9|nr:fumarylacetoacetate hydrolase family protein [Cellulomonas sp. URHD0024]